MYKPFPLEVGLNWLQHMLLLSVHINGDICEVVVFKVERVERLAFVECCDAHQPNDQSCGKLTGNHLLVCHVSVMLQKGECLADGLFYWLFGRAVL